MSLSCWRLLSSTTWRCGMCVFSVRSSDVHPASRLCLSRSGGEAEAVKIKADRCAGVRRQRKHEQNALRPLERQTLGVDKEDFVHKSRGTNLAAPTRKSREKKGTDTLSSKDYLISIVALKAHDEHHNYRTITCSIKPILRSFGRLTKIDNQFPNLGLN